MTDGDAQAEQSKQRPYSVYERHTINDEQDLDALRERYGEPVDVLVRVGGAVEITPRKALETVAKLKGMSGDFRVAADSAFAEFPGVKVDMEPRVSIG